MIALRTGAKAPVQFAETSSASMQATGRCNAAIFAN